MRVALTRGFVFWSGLAVLTLFFLPGNGEAQGVTYLGLEPEQLVALLDLSAVDRSDGRLTELDAQLATHPEARLWNEKGLILAAREEWKQAEEAFRHASHELAAARLGLAVSLVQQGEHKDALEVVEEPGGVDDDHRNRLRFARVLLRLHADVKVRFSELRQELAPFLFSASSGSSVFDLWLGLNPEREELESVLEALRPLGTPFAAWQRAEVLLRLGKVQRALREIRDLEQGPSTDDELRNRILRAQARALFQLGSDGAGQSAYRRILHRLDEPTADLLYRDIAVLASPSERGQFPALSLEEKADFFWQFWMRRHPVPVEEVNPRLAEHYRRLDQALAEYPLQSTGHGYFTDEDTFLSYSPALPYYSSRATFNRGPASRYWIDHRGLILLLHGEPDLRIGPRSHGGSNKTESWAISRFQTRPLIFNFVKRPAVGEWTLVLSLAVAATRPSAPDDPTAVYEALARGVTRSYGRLYQSRIRLHPIYRQVLEVRSRRDLLRAFRAESELMASFVTAGLGSDSTDYYTQDNTLPVAVSVSNFYSEGQPAIELDFATDLSVLDEEKVDSSSTLEATVLVYDRKWKELLTQAKREFPLGPLPSGETKIFVGTLQLFELQPEEYRLVLQLFQPETGRIGIARGRHSVTYVRHGNLGVSDLFLQQRPGGNEKGRSEGNWEAAWLPSPTRVIRRKAPSRIEFELYNLQAGESGTARYEIEERVLTLYKRPGFWSKLAGYGNLAGQILFPVYTFASQVGAFTLSQALASESAGIEVEKRIVEKAAAPMIREELQMDLSDFKPGVYTVYVTVRDLVTGDISSRFLTLQIN